MRRIGVAFDTDEEAALFVAAYAGINAGTDLHRKVVKLIAGYEDLEDDEDAMVEAMTEALRRLARLHGHELLEV